MAKTILRDAYVSVAGTVISSHVESVEITTQWDDNDVTGMGASMKEHLLGLGDGSMKFNFFQDFAASSVDALLSPRAGVNSTFVVIVKPTSAAASATNPRYTMHALLSNYSPLAGSVGKPSMTDVTLLNGDPLGIVKDTSS